MANWVKVGSILKSKNGKSNYLKVADKVTLDKGQILQIQNPRKRPGITEEQLQKIPDWVIADVFIPPAKE
jgi:hypothetical protein